MFDRVFEGLGTVIFGLVLLGNTTGYISWSVWWIVVTLWPALVIAARARHPRRKGSGRAGSASWRRSSSGSRSPTRWRSRGRGRASSRLQHRGLTHRRAGSSPSPSRARREKADLRAARRSRRDHGSAAGSDLVTVDGILAVRGAELLGEGDAATRPRSRSASSESGQTVVVDARVRSGARIDTKLSDSALWDIVARDRRVVAWTPTCPTSACATWR